MIDEKMYQLGNEPNAIRALFAYGLARKAEIGDDKVFDFSIGNPNVPTPRAVKQAMIELLEMPPTELHGYTPAPGDPGVRTTIAESINRRYGMESTNDNYYLTAGAAAALDISINAVSNAGEEFIVVAPYFPEYKVWIEQAGCTCVEVPARDVDFQLDLAAIELAVNERTKGVIINSPNNPVGVVYTEANLKGLAKILNAKQMEFSRNIFLISDEPYRDIVYEGFEVAFIPTIYDNTIVCYSYSKSFSMPGERIGYIYVSERMPNVQRVYTAVCGSGRALGYICASSLFQFAIARCIDEPADVEAYAKNRDLLKFGLSELGYTFVEPQGAFYLWVKSLEPDAIAFAERAKKHELLLVPSDCFAYKGWVRIGYCVNKQVIINAMPAFKALIEEYSASPAGR